MYYSLIIFGIDFEIENWVENNLYLGMRRDSEKTGMLVII